MFKTKFSYNIIFYFFLVFTFNLQTLYSQNYSNRKLNQDNTNKDHLETSITTNPNNPSNIVVGAIDCRSGTAVPGYYYTTDDGNTWSDGTLSIDLSAYDEGVDPSSIA